MIIEFRPDLILERFNELLANSHFLTFSEYMEIE